MKTESGFTLIETLVTCSIGVGSLSTILILVATVTKSSLQLQTVSDRHRNLILAQAHLEAALRSIESHRLPVGWRIWKQCEMKSTSGRSHSITKIKTTAAPRLGSDCISFMQLLTTHTARITSIRSSGTGLTFTGCRKDQQFKHPLPIRSYLLFGVTGAIQISNRAGQINPPCSEFGGAQIDSYTLPLATGATFQGLFPIEREYTLYIDRSSHLRYVTHTGGVILENQPIVDRLRALEINEQILPSGHPIFSINLSSVGKQSIRWQYVAALPRSSLVEMSLL